MIPKYLEFKNILNSYLKCRSNKRNKYTSLKYEFNFERSLLNLQKKLLDGSYHPSTSLCFVANKPKKREIFASTFEDRIVHHIIVREMEKIFEPIFIYDSYSCRNEKGTHKAVERLRKFIFKVVKKSGKNPFFMHLDIKNFFPAIDKSILFNLIKNKIRDKFLLRLVEQNIFFDPTENYRFVGKNYSELKNIPQQKSLFGKGNIKGIPIGNLTSQFFANVYLNKVDQFIKHKLKCRYYVRYCDDMIIIDKSKETLQLIKLKIEEYLYEMLKLNLNSRITKILPVSNGIDFLGYVIRKEYNLIRRRVVHNFREKIVKFKNESIIKTNNGIILKFDPKTLENMNATINSYLGHFKHGDSFNLTKSIFHKYEFLNNYFVLTKNKVLLRHKDKSFRYLKSQFIYFHNTFSDYIIFFQEGKYFKIYINKTENLLDHFKFKNLKPKFGFKYCYGFDLFKVQELEKICIKNSIRFVTINQYIKPSMGPIIRRISMIYKNNKRES